MPPPSSEVANWYPNDLFDFTPIAACTFARGLEGVVTVDDILDGHLCHFDKETGDLCLPADMQQHVLTSYTSAKTIKENMHGNAFQTYFKEKVIAGGEIDARMPHHNHTLSDTADNFVPKYAGSLLARGDSFSHPTAMFSSPSTGECDAYSDVTELDLRGLRSSCACFKGVDGSGNPISVDMYADLEDFGSVAANKAYAIDLAQFGRVKKIDLSDLKFTQDIVLEYMPRLETVNLDGLQYARTLSFSDLHSLRSIYMPNLKKATRVELSHNTNLMDFVAPMWNIVAGNSETMFDMDSQKNLHAVVVGCIFGADGNIADLKAQNGPSFTSDDFGTNKNSAGIDWDYIVDVHTGESSREDAPQDVLRNEKGERQGSLTWQEIFQGPVTEQNDVDWKNLGGFYNETHHEGSWGFGVKEDLSDVGTKALIAPGLVNYCGKETFQYDRLYDFGAGLEFRMNVRCDLNRNQEELALGHKYAAVIELENAPAHKQVLLAWNRNSGEAVWEPSAKCSQQSDLRGIDEKNGQMSRGRADGNGYVKFRQYLEKCDTYVYQAIADPQSEGCTISKMVYGQTNRGNALVAGTEDLRDRGRGGQDKLDLRSFL